MVARTVQRANAANVLRCGQSLANSDVFSMAVHSDKPPYQLAQEKPSPGGWSRTMPSSPAGLSLGRTHRSLEDISCAVKFTRALKRGKEGEAAQLGFQAQMDDQGDANKVALRAEKEFRNRTLWNRAWIEIFTPEP